MREIILWPLTFLQYSCFHRRSRLLPGKFIFVRCPNIERNAPDWASVALKTAHPTQHWNVSAERLPPPFDLRPLAGMLKGLKIACCPFKFHLRIPEIASVMLRVDSWERGADYWGQDTSWFITQIPDVAAAHHSEFTRFKKTWRRPKKTPVVRFTSERFRGFK